MQTVETTCGSFDAITIESTDYFSLCVKKWNKFSNNIRYPRDEQVYALAQKLTGGNFELFVTLMGDKYELYKNLDKIQISINYKFYHEFNDFLNLCQKEPYNSKIRKSVNWKKKFDEMAEWLENVKFNRIVVERQIKVIGEVIKRQEDIAEARYEEMKPLIDEINADVKDVHNVELIAGQNVFHLINDGEITQQKGGELYGERGVFVLKPPLPIPINWFVFPKKGRDQYSYAIIDENTAIKIREKMESMCQL